MSSRFLETLSRIGASVAERHARARTRAQLEHLTDRQLADIGVRRSQINAVARNGFTR